MRFTLDFGFDFLSVVINVAPTSSALKFEIWKVFRSLLNVNLSDVKISVDPSDLINEYLLDVNGKKISLSPEVGIVVDDISFPTISIVYTFRIVIDASDKFVVDTLFLPSRVNNVLSLDSLSFVLRIFKSVIFRWSSGSFPLTIPETVVTPTIDNVPSSIETIFDTIGSGEVDRSVYCKRSPSLTLFKSDGLELLTVLIPPENSDMVAIPTLEETDWIVSALKVLIPTTPSVVPNKDFTLEISFFDISVIILPFSIPSKIRDSFLIKDPDTWYIVKVVSSLTESLRNAVAPLFFPLINVGVLKVIDLFNVNFVKICTSYNDIPQILELEFDNSYAPDSNLKS